MAAPPPTNPDAALMRQAADESTNKPPCRQGKANVSAYVPARAALLLKELVAHLGVERGHPVTTQQAVCEMLIDFFQKYDVTPPAELKAASRPCPKPSGAATNPPEP